MLMRTDPFREFDRLAQQVFGTTARPAGMPMDAWQEGEEFIVALDLPGVAPDSIELDVERNVLTVKAERRPLEADTEGVQASYDAGVLTLRIPVAEKAKPRRIEITSNEQRQEISA